MIDASSCGSRQMMDRYFAWPIVIQANDCMLDVGPAV